MACETIYECGGVRCTCTGEAGSATSHDTGDGMWTQCIGWDMGYGMGCDAAMTHVVM